MIIDEEEETANKMRGVAGHGGKKTSFTPESVNGDPIKRRSRSKGGVEERDPSELRTRHGIGGVREA